MRWMLPVTLTVAFAAMVTSSVSASVLQNYPSSIRRPRGIYVVLAETHGAKHADLDALLESPAISGVALRTFWSTLQPEKNRYDFSSLDDVFAVAAAKGKSVQLILVPGFGTPSWVLEELTNCEGLPAPEGGGRGRRRRPEGARGGARSEAASVPFAPCGKATFEVSEGRAHGEARELPLPWNPLYKSYWRAFLAEVAAKYGTNSAFVSIAVAGPTAESVEIVLPRAGNQPERWGELLERSYRDASYHRSDKAFVEEWNAAVTMYGEVFTNVTLVLTRGSGLLNFTRGQGEAAQAEIMSSFARHNVGSNGKATQTSGMKACRETNAGIRGVKEMSADGSLSPRVLGGAQFDTSFSQKPAVEGCSASCDASAAACGAVTPQQALANVLSVYFDDTPAGNLYGSKKGVAPMNYLQIYAPDITYAATQPAVEAMLKQVSQRLLAQAW